VLAFIGIIALSMLIWFVGPLIAIADYKPLATDWVRVLVIFVLLSLWGLNNLRIQSVDRKADKQFSDQLAAETKPKKKSETARDKETFAEEAILYKKLKSALQTLQGSRFSKGKKLYQLPWYVIIGAPGSGKTTALQNSGLHFPLQSKMGDGPVKGAGGTRYCDWWFTNEAVIIDTAGRYTTQDNPRKTDSQAWLGFLNILKKSRPKRPLNGIIVTISLLDVAQKTPTQQALQAVSIKRRIQELNDHLGMNLPVYVIFSKVDLIAGFSAFFADLEPEDREQMWGMAFKSGKADKSKGVMAKFKDEYQALIARAHDRVLNRMNSENDPKRRAMIFEFPHQMQSLGTKIHEFLTEIFTPNQFEQSALLRGIYFLSSTQSTMPASWVSGVLPLEYNAPPPVSVGQTEKKSFFIKRLFSDMIFAESDMATINSRIDRRFRWTYRAILTVVTAFFSVGVYAWYTSYENNNQYVNAVYQDIDQYKDITSNQLKNKIDWKVLAAGLDVLKDMPTGYEKGPDDYSMDMGYGLYQGYKVGAQARTTYLKALQLHFMPALSTMLIKQIDVAGKNDERLYESLRFYLMLYNPDKMNAETFTLWTATLWQDALSGKDSQQLQNILDQHLSVALTEKITPPPIDGKRVKKAREVLTSTPLDVRLYRRLKNDYIQDHPGGFSVADVLGKKAEMLFYRRSGKQLTESIPELFTYKGFHTGFNIQNKQLAKRLADERWIYGDSTHETFSEADVDSISKRVQEYYFDEYISRWNALLKDLVIKSFNTANQGRNIVRLMASSDAPLIVLLKNIRKHTALSELPASAESAKHIAGVLAESNSKLSAEKRRLERLVPKNRKKSRVILPGQPVSNAFASLNDYINDSDGMPLSQLQLAIKELDKYFKNLAFASDFKMAAFEASRSDDQGGGAIKPVLFAVSEAPVIVQGWFKSLARDSRRVTTVATKGYINNAWQDDIVKYYEKAIKGRYPIDATSSRQVQMDDFVAFFGPEGKLDTYFNQYIKVYVDTRGDKWRIKRRGLSEESLKIFERAKRIQEAYFSGNQKTPSVKFILRPYSLDKVATQSLLDIMGVKVRYKHGPVRSYPVVWPGIEKNSSDFVLMLASKGTPLSTRSEGEWGWFRLIDQYADIQKMENNSDDYLLTFKLKGVKAKYVLRPQSTVNPFTNTEIRGFSLPQRL